MQVLESSEGVDLAFVHGCGAVPDYVDARNAPVSVRDRLCEPGTIAIKVWDDAAYPPATAVFGFVQNLMDLTHCDFFGLSTVSDLAWDAATDTLVVKFRTDSVS